jgi:hypothetical protein
MSTAMREPLVRLLDAMEAIGNDHEEIFDTDVRERVGDVIERSLVTQIDTVSVPADLGMFSDDGNEQLRSVLERYLTDATQIAGALGLDESARRSAVWDEEAASTSGLSVDEFLGWVY